LELASALTALSCVVICLSCSGVSLVMSMSVIVCISYYGCSSSTLRVRVELAYHYEPPCPDVKHYVTSRWFARTCDTARGLGLSLIVVRSHVRIASACAHTRTRARAFRPGWEGKLAGLLSIIHHATFCARRFSHTITNNKNHDPRIMFTTTRTMTHVTTQLVTYNA
jgi:hypothetical protein